MRQRPEFRAARRNRAYRAKLERLAPPPITDEDLAAMAASMSTVKLMRALGLALIEPERIACLDVLRGRTIRKSPG